MRKGIIFGLTAPVLAVVLTQIININNPEIPRLNGFKGGSTLIEGLVAYWNLDEQSGTRAKTAGTCSSCDLTAVNAPGSSGGAGSYALLSAANKAVTSSDSALGEVNTSFTASAWVIGTSYGNYRILFGSDDNPGSSRDWGLYYSSTGAGSIECYDSISGLAAAVSPNNLSAGQRSLVTVTYDQSVKKCQIYHNTTGGTPSGALTNGIKDSYAPFVIGDRIASGSANGWTGPIGPALYWGNRVLAADDITTLYNSGKGYSCSSLPTALRTNLVACWDLDEASGTRAASTTAGASCTTNCDLTAVNAPGRTAGLVENSMGMSLRSSANGHLTDATFAEIALPTTVSMAGWALNDLSTGNAAAGYGGMAAIKAAVNPILNAEFNNASWYCQTHDGSFRQLNVTPAPANFVWHLFYCSLGADGKLANSVDGAAITQSIAYSPTGTSASLQVGRGHSYLAQTPTDALGIWARALTTSELVALYNAGVGVEYPWSSIVDNWFRPNVHWANLDIPTRQRIIFSKTGVYVPEYMFPSFSKGMN